MILAAGSGSELVGVSVYNTSTNEFSRPKDPPFSQFAVVPAGIKLLPISARPSAGHVTSWTSFFDKEVLRGGSAGFD